MLPKLCFLGTRSFHKTSKSTFNLIQDSLKTNNHALYYTSSRGFWRKDKSGEGEKEEAKTENKPEDTKKQEEKTKTQDNGNGNGKAEETKKETKQEAKPEPKKEEKKPEKPETLHEKFDRLLKEIGSDSGPQLKAIYKKTLEELNLKNKAIEELTNSLRTQERANEDCRKKATELRNAVLQQVEESELQKKRLEKEIENAKVFSITKFAKDLIEVPDSLGKALELSSKEYEGKENALYEGVVATYEILLKTLEKNGIKQINPIKEKFNPNFHEALYDYVDPKAEPGTVGQVAQVGYTIGGRLLKPAKVGIIRTPPSEDK